MKTKKFFHVAAAAILALALAFAGFAVPQQTQAAPKAKTVTVTKPVSVKTGKTASYTLYQIKGKKASFQIKAKANAGKLKYKTSNKKIATVSSKGVVKTTGKKTGKVTITVYSASNKKVAAKIKVTVKNFAPKLNQTKLSLAEGASATLKVTGAGIKSVTYKSSKKAVATVSSKGVVKAVAEGSAKITATVTSKSGVKKSLTATVTVAAAPVTKDTIDYANVSFDYAEDIAKEKAAVALVPQAAAIDLTAEDAKGATGVVIVGALDKEDTENFYLNTYVAGSTLLLAGKGDATIASANSSVAGDLTVEDGKVAYALPKMDANEPVDEILTVTMNNGKVYKIHTLPEAIPDMTITGEGVSTDDAGIYTISVDKFMMRVDTDGKLIYYRDLNCVGYEYQAEGFAPQVVNGKTYYSIFVELRPQFKSATGGFSSGMYLLMDENYKELDPVTLYPNEDPNHTHGEGYLDQHEFLMLGEGHYLLLSYTPQEVNNLPKSVKGIDGTSRTYVWSGILQEVKDGKVVNEINTADYPLLYESSVEKCDYAGATLDGVDVTVGQNVIPNSYADGIQDYVHVNSLDYTLNPDGTVNKLLVSMRDQSAVYQFDMATGAIDWILGGKASTLTGYEAYTSDREDENGNAFKALTFGQHFARYANRKADGTIDGNPVVSVFDNQTGTNVFLVNPPAPFMIPNLTRTFKATIDESANTAEITDVINGTDLNKLSNKYHIASHCGSVQYDSATSVTIGWGMHAVIDNIGAFAPAGTISDTAEGFDDLRQGSRPIFTDYNQKDGKIAFELSVTRSPKEVNSEPLFSYRTYKTDIPVTKDTIDYANVSFDYAEQIAQEKAELTLVPQAAAIDLTAEDAKGATGVVLVNAINAEDTENYFLNAYVAGNALKLSGKDGAAVASAESSVAGALEVKDEAVSYVLPAIDANEPVDEILTVTMKDGKVYKIHTVPEVIPDMTITGEGVSEADAGIYTFVVDKFLARVNTEGKLIYYRNMNCVGEEHMAEGFAPQPVKGKMFFSTFVELNKKFRNAQGGYSSGMYLIMDENYTDIDQLTLLPNDDPNHTHGEGYLDQHEFLMIDEGHYLNLSYTLEKVNNLPKSVQGINGTNSAYVWAGIIQEVKDGKVLNEINTTDYPLLYESAVEKIDYAGSSLEGVDVTVGQNTVHSFADGIMDYVHVNSVDYTLDADGTVDKILVSMRHQCAVYQFDMDTAQIEWILGGKASTLTGYEAYTTDREDDNHVHFTALTYGQHFARYTNRAADGTISGNIGISVFDNQTGTAPFLANPPAPVGMYPTLTRTFKATIDEGANTAAISDVIDGLALSNNGKYHIASHCGSVQYDSATSVTIGWGLHGVIDNIGAFAPAGTVADKAAGFDDLRQGVRPIFTDYNLKDGKIAFELSVTRNKNIQSHEAMFSYRTYKTAK